MDTDPVIGFRVEQIVCLICYGIVTLLYCLQSLSICFGQPGSDKVFTIRWTSHRLGPLASLLTTLRYIDAHNVYNIFTDDNRLSSFFGNNGAALIAVLAFSIIYSVITTNSSIAQTPIPVVLPAGLLVLAVSLIIVATLSPALTLGFHNTQYDQIWLVWGAFVCFSCLVLLVLTALPLRRVLVRNLKNSVVILKENPEQRAYVENSFKSFDRTLIWSSIIIFAMGVVVLVGSITSWNTDRKTDPRNFTVSYAAAAVFLWIGLLVVLRAVWIPVHVIRAQGGGCCGFRLIFRATSVAPRKAGGSDGKQHHSPPGTRTSVLAGGGSQIRAATSNNSINGNISDGGVGSGDNSQAGTIGGGVGSKGGGDTATTTAANTVQLEQLSIVIKDNNGDERSAVIPLPAGVSPPVSESPNVSGGSGGSPFDGTNGGDGTDGDGFSGGGNNVSSPPSRTTSDNSVLQSSSLLVAQPSSSFADI